MSRRLGRPSPDPGLSASIELRRGDPPGLIDFTWVGKILASQRITPKEPPPALLQVEPTGSFGDEDLVDAWMLDEPGIGLRTQVARQVVRDHKDVSFGVISLDVSQESNIAFGIARGRTASQFFPIPDPQRSIDPGFLRSPPILQWGFDAMARN